MASLKKSQSDWESGRTVHQKFHPAGNRLAENAVQRIKKAIGGRKIEDAMEDISALNHGQPYNNKTLTPYEALHGVISPLNGIPMPDTKETELVTRD